MACRECGGPLRGEETWCPRCHARVLTAEEEEARIGGLFGAIHEGHVEARKAPWEAEERHSLPRPPRRYSRLRGGTLGLPPWLRISLTIALAMPLYFGVSALITMQGPMRAAVFALIGGWVMVYLQLLRAIWERGPVD